MEQRGLPPSTCHKGAPGLTATRLLVALLAMFMVSCGEGLEDAGQQSELQGLNLPNQAGYDRSRAGQWRDTIGRFPSRCTGVLIYIPDWRPVGVNALFEVDRGEFGPYTEVKNNGTHRKFRDWHLVVTGYTNDWPIRWPILAHREKTSGPHHCTDSKNTFLGRGNGRRNQASLRLAALDNLEAFENDSGIVKASYPYYEAGADTNDETKKNYQEALSRIVVLPFDFRNVSVSSDCSSNEFVYKLETHPPVKKHHPHRMIRKTKCSRLILAVHEDDLQASNIGKKFRRDTIKRDARSQMPGSSSAYEEIEGPQDPLFEDKWIPLSEILPVGCGPYRTITTSSSRIVMNVPGNDYFLQTLKREAKYKFRYRYCRLNFVQLTHRSPQTQLVARVLRSLHNKIVND